MPQHKNTFPAELVVTVTVPDTMQAPDVTAKAQLNFAASHFRIPMWGWIVGGIVLVLIIAALFIFDGGSKPNNTPATIQQQQQSVQPPTPPAQQQPTTVQPTVKKLWEE